MALYRAHYNRICAVLIAQTSTAHLLYFSICVVQYSSSSLTWTLLVNSAQITLAALMCLLLAIQFVRESFQMYKVTKRFRLNHYMNLLVKEGMIYYFAYVHISSFYSM